MKIYTRRGDNGTAGLLSGERISKSHERIEALGDIDELTSALGIVRMSIRQGDEEVGREIRVIQSNLLKLGAQIATWRDSPEAERYSGVGEADVRTLETAIDRIQESLPVLDTLSAAIRPSSRGPRSHGQERLQAGRTARGPTLGAGFRG